MHMPMEESNSARGNLPKQQLNDDNRKTRLHLPHYLRRTMYVYNRAQ